MESQPRQPSLGRGTTSELRNAIAAQPSGSVFSTQDLLAKGLGLSRSALDVALKRLVDERVISRAGRGLFYIPQRHAVLGDLPPKLESIAAAVARRTGDQVLPGGAEAINRLGLSPQVPALPVFYTTGRASRQRAGTRTFELRHRTARIAQADPTVASVIEALRTLGKRRAADPQVARQLQRSLSGDQKRQLAMGVHLAPGWMHRILRSIVSGQPRSAPAMDGPPFSVPQTSPTRYLSGIVALNIISPQGTGDWHQDIFLRPRVKPPRSFIIEQGQAFDPSALLGTAGIYDASAMLDAMHVPHPAGPVYAASHARAIADLVLGAVLRDESPDFVALDDWMPRDQDKRDVLALLDSAAPHLSQERADTVRTWGEQNLRTEKLPHGRAG